VTEEEGVRELLRDKPESSLERSEHSEEVVDSDEVREWRETPMTPVGLGQNIAKSSSKSSISKNADKGDWEVSETAQDGTPRRLRFEEKEEYHSGLGVTSSF